MVYLPGLHTYPRSPSITIPVIIFYLTYFFHTLHLAPTTLSNYLSTFKDPLLIGFGIAPRCRAMDLLLRGFVNQQPTRQPARPFWSLQMVLALLQSPKYCDSFELEDLLKCALFLVTLTLGLRASQLKALIHFPAFPSFPDDLSQVVLPPHPSFMATKERVGHCLQPVTVPVWKVEGGLPPSLVPGCGFARLCQGIL